MAKTSESDPTNVETYEVVMAAIERAFTTQYASNHPEVNAELDAAPDSVAAGLMRLHTPCCPAPVGLTMHFPARVMARDWGIDELTIRRAVIALSKLGYGYSVLTWNSLPAEVQNESGAEVAGDWYAVTMNPEKVWRAKCKAAGVDPQTEQEIYGG